MPVGGSAGRARARGDVFAERVNAAADLLDAGVPAAEAARELASRFGCSPRQAHRYVQRAARSGHVAVPAPTAVFTVKLPVPLITPWLSSLWIGLVTPVDAGVARPLVEGVEAAREAREAMTAVIGTRIGDL